MINNSQKIKELEDKIEELKLEKDELIRKNSGYFIGVSEDVYGDYSDRMYEQIGFITEDAARKWVEESEEKDGLSYYYFEVSFDVYELYEDWYYVEEALLYLRLLSNKRPGFASYMEELNELEDSIRKSLKVGNGRIIKQTHY